MAKARGEAAVYETISSTLSGSAFRWYLNECTEDDRTAYAETLKVFTHELTKRFRMPQGIAANEFNQGSYLRDFKRDPGSLRRRQHRYALNAGLPDAPSTYPCIWQSLEVPIQRLVADPSACRTLGEFVRRTESIVPILQNKARYSGGYYCRPYDRDLDSDRERYRDKRRCKSRIRHDDRRSLWRQILKAMTVTETAIVTA